MTPHMKRFQKDYKGYELYWRVNHHTLLLCVGSIALRGSWFLDIIKENFKRPALADGIPVTEREKPTLQSRPFACMVSLRQFHERTFKAHHSGQQS